MIVTHLLAKQEFLFVATSDRTGRPSVVPKFLLKAEKPFVYLLDYSFGRTTEYLRKNPWASLSFMDLDNLESYRLNGSVELIEEGEEFELMTREVERKIVKLTADRVIDAARTGKRYQHYELEIPNKYVIIKFKIEEVTKIDAAGDFFREKE